MISRSELQEFLWNEGVMPSDGMLLADSNYSLPSWEWVTGEFARAFRTLLFDLGISEWKPESGDCDDFARLAAAHAGICHRRSGHKTGLAFGEFWFTQRTGGGHAINAVLVVEDGKRVLKFFEPQNQGGLLLTKGEVQSCSAVRF